MELRQLEYFVAVVDEASFTRAAAKLHVAQPGVSAQVRRLEAELGEELLDRSGRGVSVTEVGAAVLPYARAALDAAAGVRLVVGELTGLVSGHVAVGVVTAGSGIDLADLLAGFRRVHPAVDITLAEGNSAGLLDALAHGRLDMAVVGSAGAPPAGVLTQVVAEQPLVAAVGEEDPLAGRARVRLAALRERALICLPRGSGMRAALDAGCAAAGFEPRIAFEAGDPNVLAQLAGRGLGVAVLPRSLVDAHPARLHAVEITRPRLRARIELAWRSDGPASPAARALIAHARALLAGHRG